jgi:TPR repeat protein
MNTPGNYHEKFLELANQIHSSDSPNQETGNKIEQLYQFIHEHSQKLDPEEIKNLKKSIQSEIIETDKAIHNTIDLALKDTLQLHLITLGKVFTEIKRILGFQEKPKESLEVEIARFHKMAISNPEELLNAIQNKINELKQKNKDDLDLTFSNIQAEPSNGLPYTIVGEIYLNGRIGITTDLEKAVEFFQKGTLRGDPVAKYYLGNCFALGRGINQNAEIAEEFWKEAYLDFMKIKNQSDGRQNYFMALCHLEGKGVKSNPEQAEKYLIKAAEQGYGPAFIALMREFPDKQTYYFEKFKAHDWEEMYLQGAALGSLEAYDYLASSYLSGELSKVVNDEKAFIYIWQGIEAGDLSSLLLLAEFYKIKGKQAIVKAIAEESRQYITEKSSLYKKLGMLE